MFLFVYTLVLVYISYKLNIREDEGYSLLTSSFDLKKVINLSYRFEGQPPGYFFILALWRKMNESILFARLLSIIFIILSAYILNRILREFFEKLKTRWVIVLFLLNPYTVYTSHDIRTYSFLILLSTLSCYLFLILQYKNDLKYKSIFSLICLIGVYTQYYFIFLIATFAVVVFVKKGWNALLNFCIFLIPIALLFIPNLYYIYDQYTMHQNLRNEYTIKYRILSILVTPQEFYYAVSKIQFARYNAWISRLLFGGIMIYSFVKLHKTNSIQKFKEYNSIVLVIVSIIFIFLLFQIFIITTGLVYENKYMTVIYPLFCISYILFNIHSKLISNIIYSVFSIYFIVILIYNYRPPLIQEYNYFSTSKYVEKIIEQNEPILLYDKSLMLTFKNYYHGNNQLCPLPEAEFDQYYFNNDLKDTIDLERSIDKIKIKSRTFLLITGNDQVFNSDIKLTRKMTDQFLNNNYLILNDTLINGKSPGYDLRIRRIEKK